MSGRLLFVIIMYSFHKIQTQALLPPTLTVTQAVITERDSVTLKCQTPSSVSVSQCSFYIGSKVRDFSCLKTLTATELLQISHQSSPADVKVECFYTVEYVESPHSDTTSINVYTLLPPNLTVNPLVITDADSVTLNCQAPSSVSVSQCYIYTMTREGKKNIRGFSCLRTVTGTDLLWTASQSSPAEVKVKCFYTVKLGQLESPSPHSDTTTITIRNQKPELSLHHFPGEYVLFTCTLPGSANHDTRCNLYFGEASDPVSTTTIGSKRTTKTNQWFCQFTVTIDDLLSRLRLVQQSDASCDYSLGSEPNSLSPRSDRYSLTDIMEKERGSNKAPIQSTVTITTDIVEVKPETTLAFTMTTISRLHSSTPAKHTSGQTAGNTGSSFSVSHTTPVKPTSVDQTLHGISTEANFNNTTRNPASAETWTWKLAVAAGFGVAVGVILLGLVLLCKRGTEKCSYKRTQANVTDDYTPMRSLNHGGLLPAGNGEVYSEITSVPGADCPTGSKKMNIQEPRNEDSDVYHEYSTISEQPPPSALKDMMYSTIQLH